MVSSLRNLNDSPLVPAPWDLQISSSDDADSAWAIYQVKLTYRIGRGVGGGNWAQNPYILYCIS